MFPVLQPSPTTLARYGLSLAEWKAMVKKCKGVCPICGKLPPSLRLVIDHEHRAGWALLPPEERKLYVRGLLCSWCNFRMLPRTSTPAKLRAAAKYLEDYEKRRP